MLKESIKVGLDDREYPIHIGSNLVDALPEYLAAQNISSRVTIITNTTVNSLYGSRISSLLEESGFAVSLIQIEDGEQFKTLETLSYIYDELVRVNIDRGSGIVALGGGVVGDIAGFAAATFLRGIPYVQVPTTLLAQVDSSVGGKTAVNHRLGKNLIGAFNQPELVCIDIDVLKSLPPREYRAGLAEVVKYGIIRDRAFFEWLKNCHDQLLAKKPEALVHAIKTSCQIKADIVEIDEKETSLRAILNYGHTFGHAIESLTEYREYLHGEAVSMGMVLAATAAHELGYCTSHEVDEIRNLLLKFDLPIDLPAFTLDDYIGTVMHDKKVKVGQLNMVFNKGIGDCILESVEHPEILFGKLIRQDRERGS